MVRRNPEIQALKATPAHTEVSHAGPSVPLPASKKQDGQARNMTHALGASRHADVFFPPSRPGSNSPQYQVWVCAWFGTVVDIQLSLSWLLAWSSGGSGEVEFLKH